MTRVPLDQLNGADKDAFVAALGDVYEHAPWVAEEAFARKPFACLLALHEAMMAAVRAALPPQRAALISGQKKPRTRRGSSVYRFVRHVH